MTALIWEESPHAEHGYLRAGDKRIRIASVGWGLVRNTDTPWELAVELPGFAGKRWKFASKDEAKAKADRLLAAFTQWSTDALQAVP